MAFFFTMRTMIVSVCCEQAHTFVLLFGAIVSAKAIDRKIFLSMKMLLNRVCLLSLAFHASWRTTLDGSQRRKVKRRDRLPNPSSVIYPRRFFFLTKVNIKKVSSVMLLRSYHVRRQNSTNAYISCNSTKCLRLYKFLFYFSLIFELFSMLVLT